MKNSKAERVLTLPDAEFFSGIYPFRYRVGYFETSTSRSWEQLAHTLVCCTNSGLAPSSNEMLLSFALV